MQSLGTSLSVVEDPANLGTFTITVNDASDTFTAGSGGSATVTCASLGTLSIDCLQDVSSSGIASGEFLRWNGSSFVPSSLTQSTCVQLVDVGQDITFDVVFNDQDENIDHLDAASGQPTRAFGNLTHCVAGGVYTPCVELLVDTLGDVTELGIPCRVGSGWRYENVSLDPCREVVYRDASGLTFYALAAPKDVTQGDRVWNNTTSSIETYSGANYADYVIPMTEYASSALGDNEAIYHFQRPADMPSGMCFAVRCQQGASPSETDDKVFGIS